MQLKAFKFLPSAFYGESYQVSDKGDNLTTKATEVLPLESWNPQRFYEWL